jgi:two-component system response regulator QseB
MRLLIIEDDRTIAENLYEYLESRGHQCDYADCLATASRLLDEQVFEAAVLDRNLPDGDGLALARRLRAKGNPLPLLILTARDTLEDKLLGFDAGGGRLPGQALCPAGGGSSSSGAGKTQRARARRPASCAWERWNMTARPRRCVSPVGALQLPPKALRLVAELLSQPNRVFSRRELEIAIWGHEQESNDNLRSVPLHAAACRW